MCSPNNTAGISSSMLHAKRFELATVLVHSMLLKNFVTSEAFAGVVSSCCSLSGFKKLSAIPCPSWLIPGTTLSSGFSMCLLCAV